MRRLFALRTVWMFVLALGAGSLIATTPTAYAATTTDTSGGSSVNQSNTSVTVEQHSSTVITGGNGTSPSASNITETTTLESDNVVEVTTSTSPNSGDAVNADRGESATLADGTATLDPQTSAQAAVEVSKSSPVAPVKYSTDFQQNNFAFISSQLPLVDATTASSHAAIQTPPAQPAAPVTQAGIINQLVDALATTLTTSPNFTGLAAANTVVLLIGLLAAILVGGATVLVAINTFYLRNLAASGFAQAARAAQVSKDAIFTLVTPSVKLSRISFGTP